jgi:uncharacterized Tic20 family protein
MFPEDQPADDRYEERSAAYPDERYERHERDDFKRDDSDERDLHIARPKSDDCTMAMLCHVGGLMGFIIPLVIWLVSKDKSRFIDFHGKEVVNFQLTLLIIHVCNAILMFCLVGFFTFLATFVFSLVFHIQGAMAASRGELFHYPMSIHFIK